MAWRYGGQELNKAYEINEREKKRQYNEQILEVEHGSTTPSPAPIGHDSPWWEGKQVHFTLVYQSQLPKNVKSHTV